MVKRFNNQFLRDNTCLTTKSQMLFYQKMVELLHAHSGISYSFKIHNSYTILKELLDAIIDYEKNKINGMTVEELRKEAKKLLANDQVIQSKYPELYETVKEELSAALKMNNVQGIDSSSIPKMNMIKETIKQLFHAFKPIDYLQSSLVLTKNAIDNDEGNKIVSLCQTVVSAGIMIGRTITGMNNTLYMIFSNRSLSFDENWRRFSAIMLIAESKYFCYIPIKEEYSELISSKNTGIELKQLYAGAARLELLDDSSLYYKVEVSAPASDLPAIYNKAFACYRNEMSIIEFATAKVDKLMDSVFAYDQHNNGIIKIEKKESEFIYKPYNQYHVNIDQAIKEFTSILNEQDLRKVLGTVTNVCNFERESKEYGFLLLWSSLEAMFRSSQFETAIGAIKNIIPDILCRRYIYYRLVDFIKDAEKAEMTYCYEGNDFIKRNPSDSDIETLYQLLQVQSEFESLANLCEGKYVLLYNKCTELRNMIINAGSIKNVIMHHKETLEFHLQRMYRVRNKFMHHAEIDKKIEPLYKHLLVYTWECIREMSYVSKSRGIKSLEELYAYFRMNYNVSLKLLRDARNPVDFQYIKKGYL